MSEEEHDADTTLCDLCSKEIRVDESIGCECGLTVCENCGFDGRCKECDAKRGDFTP